MKDEGPTELGSAAFGKEGEEGADNGPIEVLGENKELLLLLLLLKLLWLLPNTSGAGDDVYMAHAL
jgi:hypothetical protein